LECCAYLWIPFSLRLPATFLGTLILSLGFRILVGFSVRTLCLTPYLASQHRWLPVSPQARTPCSSLLGTFHVFASTTLQSTLHTEPVSAPADRWVNGVIPRLFTRVQDGSRSVNGEVSSRLSASSCISDALGFCTSLPLVHPWRCPANSRHLRQASETSNSPLFWLSKGGQ